MEDRWFAIWCEVKAGQHALRWLIEWEESGQIRSFKGRRAAEDHILQLLPPLKEAVPPGGSVRMWVEEIER